MKKALNDTASINEKIEFSQKYPVQIPDLNVEAH